MNNNKNNTNFSSVAGASAFFTANNRALQAESFAGSREDLASFGDEVDTGNFKGLYPREKRNGSTTYRIISRDYVLANATIIKFDFIAMHIGKEKNGEQLGAFLLRDPIEMAGRESIEQVVVNSHGSISTKGVTEVILTPEMPVISFLGPHGKVLDAGVQHINPYAEVSFQGITLTSQQAKTDFDADGYKAITGASTLGAIHNYGLQKFEDKPMVDSKHYLENVLAFMQIQRNCAAMYSEEGVAYESDASKSKPEVKFIPLFDTLAIRGRGPELRAHDTIKVAQEYGYKKIICNFCRCKNGMFSFPKTYVAEDTKLLEKPISYTWAELRVLEQNKMRVLENEAELSSAPRMSL